MKNRAKNANRWQTIPKIANIWRKLRHEPQLRTTLQADVTSEQTPPNYMFVHPALHSVNCLNNLIEDPAHDEALTLHRRRLQTWMRNTGDAMLQIYKDRENVDKREAYIQMLERVSKERQNKKKKNNQNNK